MALFKWNPSFAVDIPEIDSQHKRLFEYAEALHEAMAGGKGKEVVGPLLQVLIDYTKAHFASEEKVQAAAGYPKAATHKAAHDALTAKVLGLQAQFASGNTVLSFEIMTFLKEWLVNHIGKLDMDVGAHLKSARAKAA